MEWCEEEAWPDLPERIDDIRWACQDGFRCEDEAEACMLAPKGSGKSLCDGPCMDYLASCDWRCPGGPKWKLV